MLSSFVQAINCSKYSKKNERFLTQCERIAFTLCFISLLPLRCCNTSGKYLTSNNVSRDPAIVFYEYDTPWFKPDSEMPQSITCYSGFVDLKCTVYPDELQAPEDAEAYIFYGMTMNTFPLPRYPKTIWSLVMDETPINNPILLHEKALNLFNLSSTFSRYSDIPIPLQMLRDLEKITSTEYFVNTSSKNALLCNIAPVVFFNRDCHTFTERETYVKELNKYVQIDSYGECLHNKDFPFVLNINDSLYEDTLMRYLAKYKFIVAIENAICIDYITEKLWRALEIGVVPIYYGSPMIRDWLPNQKSAILLEDFPTPKVLSQHLHYLMRNDTAYEEYLNHKTLRYISNNNLIHEMQARPYQNQVKSIDEFLCFVCRRIHDTNYNQVNIVTKNHYNCPTPIPTALSLSANPNSLWGEIIRRAKLKVDSIYKEIEQSNTFSNRRKSNTSWDTSGVHAFSLRLMKVKEDVSFFFR